jgi:FtsP/CotA-like multicopper oxidase with cupredoxin domain
MSPLRSDGMSRRRFLSAGIGAAAGIALGPLVPLSTLVAASPKAKQDASAPGGQLRDLRLTVAEGEVDLGAGEVYRTWLYNGAFPGPELRVREGDRLRIADESRRL